MINKAIWLTVIVPSLAFVSAAAAPASADVYRTVDKDGNVVFTDVAPADNPEPVDLTPPNTYSAPDLPAVSISENTDPLDSAVEYQEVAVVAPEDDEALRNNAGNVTLRAALTPALAADHQVQFTVDGVVMTTGRSLSLQLNNLDRGTHTVQVHVMGPDNQVIHSSSTTTFHLLRYSAPQRSQP